jgi:hypothetical protein
MNSGLYFLSRSFRGINIFKYFGITKKPTPVAILTHPIPSHKPPHSPPTRGINRTPDKLEIQMALFR